MFFAVFKWVFDHCWIWTEGLSTSTRFLRNSPTFYNWLVANVVDESTWSMSEIVKSNVLRHVNSQNVDLQLICKKAPRHGHSWGSRLLQLLSFFHLLTPLWQQTNSQTGNCPSSIWLTCPLDCQIVKLSGCQDARLSGCQAVRLSGCLLGAPEQAPPGRGGAAAGPAAAGQSVAHQSPNDGGGEEGSRSSRPPSRCPSCPAARSPWHHRPPTDWATELGAVAAGGGGGRISSWSRLSSSSAPQTSTLVPIPPTTRARQYSSPHRFHFHANIPKIFTLTQISQEIFSRTEFSILPNFSPINFLRPTDRGGR